MATTTDINESASEAARRKFNKKRLALANFVRKNQYMKLASSLNLAELHHNGFRKDGVTPEFEHQLDMVFYGMKLHDIPDMEAFLCVLVLHDLREDYGAVVSENEITNIIGSALSKSIALLNKFNDDGTSKKKKAYYRDMASDLFASLGKGLDRIHNMYAMRGIFDIEKQMRYAKDAKDYIIPMLQKAASNFPQQTHAYTRIVRILENQILWVHAQKTASLGEQQPATEAGLEMNVIPNNLGL